MFNTIRAAAERTPNLVRAMAFSAVVGGGVSDVLAKGLPPAPTAPVNDLAHLIAKPKVDELNAKLGAFERQYHHQMVVYTVDSVQSYGYGSIEELANDIGHGYRI